MLVFLAGCASFGAEMEGLQRTVMLYRDQYKDGIYVYRAAPGVKDIESVAFTMSDMGQVDMNVKYLGFSFVYGLGLKYEERTLSSEARVARLTYKIDNFTFLSRNEIHAVVPKQIAEKVVGKERIELIMMEKVKEP
jgi:hypothetical protein